MGTRLSRFGLTAALVGLLASPCVAAPWDDLMASFGPPTPPAAVLDYLKTHPLVQAAPTPSFREIKTERFDGSVAQQFKLAGFDHGFGRVEGTRDERIQGNRRSGAQTISMVTALGGLVLVSLENKTTQGMVFLRQIVVEGAFLPPTEGKALSVKFERVQLASDAIVEEIRDCTFNWLEPAALNPILGSRCTGSVKVSKPERNGEISVVTSPDVTTQSFVFRRDLGWIFDQNTRILDFKRATP
jgi:hypothetical protein